jgi:hypothetical protein
MPVVDGITFEVTTRDCAYCVASLLMPLEYPFIELGMREDVFMGTAKTFLKISASRFAPTLLYRKFFERNLNTGRKKFLKKVH